MAEKGRASKAKGPQEVVIPRPKLEILKVTVIGDTPLLCHRFSDKAMEAIADGQAKKPKSGTGVRDPDAEFRACLYVIKPGKYGFPASAFKRAMVDACRFVSGMKMTLARGAFFVMGDLLEIKGSKPFKRMDPGRNQKTGGAVLIYRAEFTKWSVDLTIRYNANAVSPGQLLNLLANAGFSIGIGDWRASCKNPGTKGMFHVKGAA